MNVKVAYAIKFMASTENICDKITFKLFRMFHLTVKWCWRSLSILWQLQQKHGHHTTSKKLKKYNAHKFGKQLGKLSHKNTV